MKQSEKDLFARSNIVDKLGNYRNLDQPILAVLQRIKPDTINKHQIIMDLAECLKPYATTEEARECLEKWFTAVEKPNEMQYLLNICISSDCFESFKHLLGLIGGVNARCGDGEYPLIIAALKNRLGMVKYMIENGFNLEQANAASQTALFIACGKGHLEVAMALIDAGANVNTKDVDHITPIAIAVDKQHTKVAEFLLEETDADPNICSLKHNYSPLCRAAYYGNVELVKCLLKDGASLYINNDLSQNALHLAASNGYLPIVKEIAEGNQSYLECKDIHGMTPILIAANKGHLNVVQYLIEKGANINVTDRNGYDLFINTFASSNNFFVRIKIAESLLQAGARCKDDNIGSIGNSLTIALHNIFLKLGLQIDGQNSDSADSYEYSIKDIEYDLELVENLIQSSLSVISQMRSEFVRFYSELIDPVQIQDENADLDVIEVVGAP